MRSMRLNKSMKEEILNNVVKVWLTKHPVPDLEQASYDLALFALVDHYEDFDSIMSIYNKHRELFNQGYWGIQLQVGTEFLRPGWDREKYGYLPLPENTLLMSPDCPAYVSYRSVHEAWREHHKTLTEVTKQASTIIDSCSTSRKLVEVWPEIAPYVEPYIREGNVNLPAVPIKDINQILGW